MTAVSPRSRELTGLFVDYFSLNRVHEGRRPVYRVTASEGSDGGGSIDLHLTFRSGCTYCCVEPGCHFGPDWARLRRLAHEAGVTLADPLTVTMNVTVEAGVQTDIGTEINEWTYTHAFCEHPDQS